MDQKYILTIIYSRISFDILVVLWLFWYLITRFNWKTFLKKKKAMFTIETIQGGFENKNK